MDAVIESKGTQYKLVRINPHKKHFHKVTHNKNTLAPIFSGAKVKKPNSWTELGKKAGIKTPAELADEKKIIEKLIHLIIHREVDIIAENPIAGAVGKNSGGAPGGSGGQSSTGGNNSSSQSANTSSSQQTTETVPLGPEARDKRVDSPSGGSTTKPGDAPASTAPSENNDQPVESTCTDGDPVSLTSGEEMLQFSDCHLPGPMRFEFQRTYRSGNPRNSGLGYGWTHSGTEYIDVDQVQATYYDSEGRGIFFNLPKLNQSTQYIPEGLTLTRLSEDSFIIKQEGQWDKFFRRPANGQQAFRLAQLRHPGFTPAVKNAHEDTPEAGFAIHFHYSGNGYLNRIKGNWGKSLLITRDNHNQISQIHLSNDRLEKTKLVAEYDYNEDQDLIAQRNAKGAGEQYQYENHLIQQRTLATGFNFYFKWDGTDHKARCIHNWGDRGIYSYLFHWDPASKTSKSTDSRGFSRTVEYNEYGQITKEIDNEGHTHRYSYSNGRKDSYTDPLGHTTDYFYDSENCPAGTKDALGNSISLSYFKGKLTSFTDKDKSRWQLEYDKNGQLVKQLDPYKQATHYAYNPQGLVSTTSDPLKRVTRYYWTPQGVLEAVVDPLGHKRQFTYDDWGQLISVELSVKGDKPKEFIPSGTTYFEYNETGQVTKVTSPNDDVTSYTYNENDQLIKHSDPQGRTTEFVYDGLNQVVERIDAEGHKLQYEYDTERNLTALINEKGEKHEFFYDGNEKLVKEIGFDGRIQHYKYNEAGQLIKHMDAGEIVTDFERDALGHLLTKNSYNLQDKNQPQEKIRYRYDAKSRLLETYNNSQWLSFEYNKFGSLVKESRCDLNNKMQKVLSTAQTIQYGNIWPGIRSGIQLPDGQRIDYQFDQHNMLTDVLFNGENITHIQRDKFGREVTRQQGALVTENEYDLMGRISKQHSFNQKHKSQGPIHREYGYDQFGNLNQLIDGPRETRYVYDMLNRLKKVEGEHSEEFSFDPASNLLKHGEGEEGISKGNRLLMQGDSKFAYDARGNLIQERRGKEGKLHTTFEYNLQNQLVRVNKRGQVTEYKYDPLGRRVEKSDESETTQYLWAGDQLAQEKTTGSEEQHKNIKKTYVYEPESFKPVAMVQDNEVYHYHLDHLGTPRELTNREGEVVWKAQYKTYGNVAAMEVEEVENNLRFQGQYYDDESGLHYNRHRYYNPSTGQFVTQDPIGLLGGVNNYQYAPNPTQWVDPLGLKCKENSWNQFQKDTKGHFANSSEASKAYQRMKQVEVAPRGAKPNSASDYLPDSYVNACMQKFSEEGGAFIVIESWTTGSRFSTLPPRKFVGLPSEMRPVIAEFESSGDVAILNDQLNLGLDSVELAELAADRIMYVEIEPGDPRFSYDMPSGNEFGAIEGEWKPGGKTKAGVSEAALVGSENIDHGKSLSGYSKEFKNTRIIKDK